jgi:hypothetical protein
VSHNGALQCFAPFIDSLDLLDAALVASSPPGYNARRMIPQQPKAMPDDLRQSFRDAVRLFYRWRPGERMPTVKFRTMVVSLSGVCDLVLAHRNEPLPLDVHHELLALIDVAHLKSDLLNDPSLEMGARCVDRLIQERIVGSLT